MAQEVETLPPTEVGKPPVLEPGQTFEGITQKITSVVTLRPPGPWYIGFFISFVLLMVFLVAATYLFAKGVGIWGINIPVAWAVAITNFVWWIGIGHAGTLISAILLLLHQQWRTSINRFAEAMTLFAVACAGLFPILHLGRPWYFYFLIPYPSAMGVWPQFRSPLVWDFFAVSTYFTVSLLFWYLGLVPDFATLRDRAKKRGTRILSGILALGWRGSARHWHRYEMAYLLLAGLATPLVVSVHSVVSLDFAVAQVPGWHSTIFPPYFVAGALFSGFAMVLTIAIPVRALYGLQDFITMRHLQAMAKLMLATGLIVTYSYIIEGFLAWYSGNVFEEALQVNRLFGPYKIWYWALLLCNVLIPQAIWFKAVRNSALWIFLVAIVVNVGMWIERYDIIVISLSRDFLPSSWAFFAPTFWDWATFLGSVGLFLTLMFLFLRLVPAISMSELRGLIVQLHEERHGEKEEGVA